MKNQISKIALTACFSLMACLAFAQAPNPNNVAPRHLLPPGRNATYAANPWHA